MVAGPSVVEIARSAVRRLADAAPAADVARDALEVIERIGIGPPYTVAVAGDLAARTELLNYLAGERLFDPARRDPARVVMTLRRGPVTALRMRRRDGSVEQRKLGSAPGSATVEEAAPVAEPGPVAEVPDSVARASAPAPASSAVPAISGAAEPATTLLVRRPPWWALWRWPVFWWRTWRARGRIRSLLPAIAPAPAATDGGPGAIPVVPGEPTGIAAPVASPASQRRIVRTVERPGRVRDALQPLVDALRGWLVDDAVERLFVEVAGGPLPEQLVMIELPSRADARSLDSVAADACLVACGERGFAMTAQLQAVLAIVPHLFIVGAARLPPGAGPRVRLLGGFAIAARALVQLSTIERQIAVGERAIAALSAGCTAIDGEVSNAELGFRARLDRLEALRIPDADRHTAAALARVRQTTVEHAHRVMQRALDDLDRAIERSGAAWAALLGGVASTDALRAAAARLDEESPAALQAAQADVHRALVDDLTEQARAHYRELVGELGGGTARGEAVPSWLTVDVRIADMTGPSEARGETPEVVSARNSGARDGRKVMTGPSEARGETPEVVSARNSGARDGRKIKASGTSLGAVAPRLTSLFRSLDALKTDALAQLEQRIARLRQVARANLLDAEPRLEPAVTGAVAVALRAEVERHGVWLEGELARERIAIDAERAQLTLLALARDAAHSDERQLITAVALLTSELP